MKQLKIGILLLVLLLSAFAAQAQDDEILKLNVSDGHILFQPKVAHAGMDLRVSGPDGLMIRQSDPLLRTVDAEGNVFSDGQYVWEMRLTPELTEAEREELAALRGINDYEIRERMTARTVVVGGAFRVIGGLIVAGDAVASADDSDTGRAAAEAKKEELPTKDQVILDDLIVDGSICVGQDCVNGESFGFDTLRLKENNLRIKAQDTSTSASFPTFDWQLTFNDSSNGGLDKFSVDCIDGGTTPFTIEGCAPSHSLYVDNGGRVGFGTSNPVVDLHAVSGNTPTLRLEQDGSSGFTAQTWDLAGNEANFFIRDATNGSTLPFRIEPGTPSNALYLDSSGNVGLGTTNPDKQLHITENGPLTIRMENTAAVNLGWDFGAFDSGNFIISDPGDGNAEFVMDKDGNVTLSGTLTAPSDVRMKENFAATDAQEMLQKVVELPITFWNYKHTPAATHVGPTSQDFFASFGLGGTDLGIQPTNLASVALSAIQGLNEVVEEKDEKIEALEARIAALEALATQLAADK